MRINTKILFLVFFLAVILYSCQHKDEQDQLKAIRIISLAPHITEIIYTLGAGNQLIAVTDFCNYPPEAQKKENIGGLLNPNMEKMISLKPTHLFGMPSHEKLNQQFESFGLMIKMMSNEKVSDVLESIRLIGYDIGRQKPAEDLIKQINKIFDSLRVSFDYQDTIPAVLLIGRSKGSLQNMTVAGEETYINEIWKMVGGKNTYVDLPTRYGSINLESLLLRDPEVIIEFDMQKERSVEKIDLGPEWQLLKGTRAVKNRQVYMVGGNHTMIPGPRMTLLAEDFENIIQQVRKKPISN